MKVFYLRDNIVDVGEAHTENNDDDVKFVIPPKGYRLVDIQIGFTSKVCAVKKNDHRYTIFTDKAVYSYEFVDFTKVVWTQAAAVLYKKSTAVKNRKPEPESPQRVSGRKNLRTVLPLDTHISLNHSSGDFERNFKSLIREQGSGANSLLTAKFLVYSMSPGDKSELNKNLLSNGIKSPDDLNRLLSKWRSEALLANQKPERTPRRRQTVSAGYER
jgi:hypothetical protein